MRRILSIAIVVLAFTGLIFARGGMQAPLRPAEVAQSANPRPGKKAERKIIDLKSDLMGPVAPGDSAVFLVGNFAAQHNGAVITCDSAVRYSDMHIEFFGNVLINKNTTYIYGERAIYDGEVNEARVFSDLVKVVDGDATLYTYQFVFNTKENIGRFYDGGVMVNRDNVLESVRGYYYGDQKEMICVEQVEMRNDEYELTGDSVIYNTATDRAFFFRNTNIWNHDGDYLYADRGSYEKNDSLYKVTLNGYVLTEKQEMWSDSIDYYRAQEHVILRRDIQIDDAEHKVLAFGEYGEYWKNPGNAFLTRRPSMVSYDLSQGDSLFMRADSMYLLTLRYDYDKQQADSVAQADSLAAPSGAKLPARGAADSLAQPAQAADSAAVAERSAASLDSLQRDSVKSASRVDSLPPLSDTLTVAERKAILKERALKEKAAEKAEVAKLRKEKLKEIAAMRQEKITAKLTEQKEREERRLANLRLKAESKLKARQARAARKGKTLKIDSTELQRIDSLLDKNAGEMDSLLMKDSVALDSLDSLVIDSLDSLAIPRDSIYRLIKGFRNVKTYRTDFQVVCDSMVSNSTDSVIHLYIEPVLWNESNQITSDVMDIYTKNQQIIRAEFVGSPMMVAQLDTIHYNQVAGKEMTAFFRESEIYRDDVNGNAQTIYYMQDGEPPVITMMAVIESGNISFFIEDKQMTQIVYRNNPVYTIYPIDEVPDDQELYLKGFKWQGERRPTQAEVFDRTIRPSQREAKSSLRHPDFPLRMRIDEHRKRLTELRRWADRNEKVDEETIEWMRTLGFEVGQPRESAPSSAPAQSITTLAKPAAAAPPVVSETKTASSATPAATPIPALTIPPQAKPVKADAPATTPASGKSEAVPASDSTQRSTPDTASSPAEALPLSEASDSTQKR